MPRASRTALVAVAACLLCPAAALAADGDLDPEFDYDGVAAIDRPSEVTRIALQPDGGILAAGQTPGGDVNTHVIRLTETGALDPTFGGDGFVTLDSPAGIGPIAVQPDGRILVTGHPNFETGSDVIVVRLMPDGSPDPSFGEGGEARFAFSPTPGAFNNARALLVQADGRIVIAGESSSDDFVAARLNPNGDLDSTFSGDGRVAEDLGGDVERVQAAAFQGDRIVLAGTSNFERTNDAAKLRFAALALKPDGSRDTAFSGDGVVDDAFGAPSQALGITPALDGGLLLVGPAGGDVGALELDGAGRPDPTFSADGRATVDLGTAGDGASSATVSIDGKLAVLGSTLRDGQPAHALVKLSPAGGLDPDFGSGGVRVYESESSAIDLTRQPNGRLLMGLSTHLEMAVMRVVDSLPVASLTAPTIDEGRVAPFTVTLNKTAGYPITMDFVTGDGSANAGEDYTGRRGTLTIAPGERGGVIAVATTLDRLYEAADEDFRVELENLFGATFGVRIDHATLRNVLRRGRCANLVIGRRGTDIITGSSAGDRIRGRADADVLFGLGGDDCILGERGGDQIRGGDGDDQLEGGSGDDEIKGEDGKDRIIGGRGRNRYSGGAGNDRIYARNGRSEIVECGPGRDYAKVDRSDKLRRCERVARSRG